MKRSGPLKRKTALSRVGKARAQEGRALPPPRRKRVRAVSDKRRQENEARRDALLIVRGRIYCQACPVLVAHFIVPDPACVERHHGRDGHEVLTRGRGGSISDPANILYTCRPAHEWITQHPREALQLGLVASAHGPPPDPKPC